MIQDTISKIENNIRTTTRIDEPKKDELLRLLSLLKKEVLELSSTHKEDAERVTQFASSSTFETIQEKQNQASKDLSVQGLAESVTKFEASHPDLVSVVNSICTVLSNSGL